MDDEIEASATAAATYTVSWNDNGTLRSGRVPFSPRAVALI